MLVPAPRVKENLQKAELSIWHNPDYIWINNSPGFYVTDCAKNCENVHQFASVDNHWNVIGYISYTVDWASGSASDLYIVSFDMGNIRFGLDVKQAIHDIFYKYNLHRMDWSCYEDAPAYDAYCRFVSRYGGRIVGKFTENHMLEDGKLHNTVLFEMLRRDILF